MSRHGLRPAMATPVFIFFRKKNGDHFELNCFKFRRGSWSARDPVHVFFSEIQKRSSLNAHLAWKSSSMSSSDLDHVSANGKRKYCDEQGCSEETDHLSLIKCFRHSGRFHRNQRCNIAGCDNWVLSNRRCEVHGGVAKHCTHGKLKGGV